MMIVTNGSKLPEKLCQMFFMTFLASGPWPVLYVLSIYMLWEMFISLEKLSVGT